MTFGKVGHRRVHGRSPKRTEVCGILIKKKKWYSKWSLIWLMFPSTVLSRSGLCSVLWRPWADSDATCWSDTQQTKHTIILPVSHRHQGGETWWGERNHLPDCLFCTIQSCSYIRRFVEISNLIQGLKHPVILQQHLFILFCFFLSDCRREANSSRQSRQRRDHSNSLRRPRKPGGTRTTDCTTHTRSVGVFNSHKNILYQLFWQFQFLLTRFIYWLIYFLRWPPSIFRHAGWWLLILQDLWGV